MNFSHWLGIVGLVIGLVGLAYAVYENRSKKKLSDYIKSQNWYIYAKANNASASVQLALKNYISTTQDNINIDTLKWLSKADAFSQDVFKDVIRQIQESEPVFDAHTIQRWINERRITEEHSPLFLLLTPANKAIQLTPKSGATDG